MPFAGSDIYFAHPMQSSGFLFPDLLPLEGPILLVTDYRDHTLDLDTTSCSLPPPPLLTHLFYVIQTASLFMPSVTPISGALPMFNMLHGAATYAGVCP